MSLYAQIFVLLFVATTLVSGQNFGISTVYEDDQCTILNGGLSVFNVGPGCTPREGCLSMEAGLYEIRNCSDNPFPIPGMAAYFFYPTNDSTCGGGEFTNVLAAPLNLCTTVGSYAFKISGCNPQNSTVIFTAYPTVDDCKNNTSVYFEDVFVDGTCNVSGNRDVILTCPPPVPVAPPVVAPTASAPVAATPKAATPVKKSSNAAYNVISMASIAALMLVCA